MTTAKASATSTQFYNATISNAQTKQLLIDALGGDKSPEEVIKMLAEGLFPHDDLEHQVILNKIYNEVKELISKYEGFSIDDYYLGDVWYEFNFDIDSKIYLEIGTSLQEFVDYLSTKYKVNIDFRYRISQYKEYKEEKTSEEVPAEKPNFPPVFDIDLGAAS